jgi:plastocyanin
MNMLRPQSGRAVPLLATLLLAVLSAGALSACGGSSKTVNVTVKETQTGPKSYAYQGLKTIDGGTVKITFTNAAKDNPHELQLARVDSGHSAAEVKATLTKLLTSNGPVATPNWLHPQGGVGVTAPGQTATATVKLPKGSYYAVDTQSPGSGNNPPFLAQGAFAPFTVSSGSGASLPKTSGKITINDEPKDRFAFSVSGLKTGTDQITFDNASKEYHHVLAVRLLPGKTLADARATLLSNGPPKGPPPIDFQHLTGTTVSNTKTSQTAQLTFTQPGKYVLFCFLTDKDGKGKPHLQRGLLKEVTIS